MNANAATPDHVEHPGPRKDGRLVVEADTRWKSLRFIALCVVTLVVWSYLGHRLWQTEPELTVRILFGLVTVVAFGLLLRQCFFIGRTSLRVLVVGGPLLMALISLPARQVVSHLQLRQQLLAAGVDDFALGTHGQFANWMRSTASAIVGHAYGHNFDTDLTTVRINLDLSETEGIVDLPAKHLSLVTIRRSEENAALVDKRLVDWLNSIPGTPLVSLRLHNPRQSELHALQGLKQLTMLQLNHVGLQDLELDLPAVYDLSISHATTADGLRVPKFNLPALERFTVEEVSFRMSPQLFDRLSETRHVKFDNCEFDQATFDSVFRLPATNLTINHMTLPDAGELPGAGEDLGRSLTTWDSEILPSRLIEILRARKSRVAQIRIGTPFTPTEFSQLLALPDLRFVRIESRWLTKAHLMGLVGMNKRFRLSVLDATLPPPDALWLKENKGAEVNLYFQFALTADASVAASPPAD